MRAAAEQIGRALNGFTVVVTKSTVPVGTARMLERLIRDVRPDANFAMASNPEFLREGSAVEDFLRPDRIVVGLSSAQARERMSELYRPLMLRDVPVLFTNFETAELIKYAANAYLATRIGFINEMADLCEAVGADVSAVTRGMGLDRRIGLHYLQPGPGFGGSCFPRTRGRSPRSPSRRGRGRGSSKRSSRPTPRARTGSPSGSRMPWAAACATSGWRCSVSASRRRPTI